jgi:hypothetical protein
VRGDEHQIFLAISGKTKREIEATARTPMRRDNNSKFLASYGLRYGADTSGLTVDNVPEFVRKRAYELFEMRGRQRGHELDDWLQAEGEIRSRFGIFEI